MKSYLKVSKIASIFCSPGIIIISIVDVKNYHWPNDLFPSISLFSLIIMLDFLFYEVFEKNNYWVRHSNFCTFPITRYRVLFLEAVNYFRRWEVVLYLISVLFFISKYYLTYNTNILRLVSIIALYNLQTVFLVLALLIIKNIISEKNFDISLRTSILTLFFTTNLLTVFSEKGNLIHFIFTISPFSNGFLSFLISEDRFAFTSILALITTLLMILIIKRRFKSWVHS